MKKYTVIGGNECRAHFAHAFAKNLTQLQAVAAVVYPGHLLVLDGHCEAVGGAQPRDMADDAKAHYEHPRASLKAKNVLAAYLNWVEDPIGSVLKNKEAAKAFTERNRLVEAFVNMTVGGENFKRYGVGDFANLYRAELGNPDFLFFEMKGNCGNLSAEMKQDFHNNTGGRLQGVDPGYQRWSGCRKVYDISGVGQVTVDFWGLRHYLDES